MKTSIKWLKRIFADVHVFRLVGVLALALLLCTAAIGFRVNPSYVLGPMAMGLLALLGTWSSRRWRAWRSARQFKNESLRDRAQAKPHLQGADNAPHAIIRYRLLEAVKTIKTSKLGEQTGPAALYELPWCMVIGSPAAGKSAAILRSGLRFPLADGAKGDAEGKGATRNCDWFFTSDAVFIDTPGRYCTQEEFRDEWMLLLGLLKKHRPKAPINAILVAASIGELDATKPDATIELAKKLRRRIQELTETLEVVAPVYVVFTKADLIAGFAEFFEDQDPKDRQEVWGASLPYGLSQLGNDVEMFDRYFDELRYGLKHASLARMSSRQGQQISSATLAFPLEFAAAKTTLRSFIATLFENNPYQHSPVFRGFYFTSAMPSAKPNGRVEELLAERFSLLPCEAHVTATVANKNGFFLKNLFSSVLSADRLLVRRHGSRLKLRNRTAGISAGVLLVVSVVTCWSWNFLDSRKLINSIDADLARAVQIQKGRNDLASRLQALEIIQNRIEDLKVSRQNRLVSFGIGSKQEYEIERRLRREYFGGVRKLMLEPVAKALEVYLESSISRSAELESTIKAEEVYQALQTYVMLAQRDRFDAAHLTEQVRYFWANWAEANRGEMSRDELLRGTERVIAYAMANLRDPDFPVITNKLGLVDQSRDTLRRILAGRPAILRVYNTVKERASKRYEPMTIARIVDGKAGMLISGSYVISGGFTREAWEGYIREAFQNASNHELQSSDWVLNTSTRDDLSLQASPEQIQKQLRDIYESEYTREWRNFIESISIAEFHTLDEAINNLTTFTNDTASPIRKLFETIDRQTRWNGNSDIVRDGVGGNPGIWDRLTLNLPRRALVELPSTPPDAVAATEGPVRDFAAVGRIVQERDGNVSLLAGYFGNLSRLRTRFDQIKSEGDIGPAASKLMAATLEGKDSEISDALKFVDEQMLTGADELSRSILKPLLLRPLVQSFKVIVGPTETELNRVWSAQVLLPFQQSLSGKYPFDLSSKIDASPAEIGRIFGPHGAIAKLFEEFPGPLFTRRGDALSPRLWADLGLRLRSELIDGFPYWVSSMDGYTERGNFASNRKTPSVVEPMSFQLLAIDSPDFTQYEIEIDGQRLVHRNGTSHWEDFVWPRAAETVGARLLGVTTDGRVVELFSAQGDHGFERLIDAATVKKLSNEVRELSWGTGGRTVTVQYRAINSAVKSNGGSRMGAFSLRGLRLPSLVVGLEQKGRTTHAATGTSK